MTAINIKEFPVSWDELHRHARALTWRLLEAGPFDSIVTITRSGLVPELIVSREPNIHHIEAIGIAPFDHQDQGTAHVLKEAGAGDGNG